MERIKNMFPFLPLNYGPSLVGLSADQPPPKPECTYSCLIGLALTSSKTGRMTVGSIYNYLQYDNYGGLCML